MNSKIKIALAAAMLAGTSAAMAQAQSPVVHASRGQSAQQQARDESACQTQARKRTGYDPISIAANSQPFQPGKDMTSVPIEAPTTAMGASSAGATSAGAGQTGMEQGGVAGAAGSSQTGATATGAATGMPETGTMPPAATTGGGMAQGSTTSGGTMAQGTTTTEGAMAHPGEPVGAATAQAGTSGTTGTEQAGMEHHGKKHHKMKKHHEGATGGSAAGATGAGGGQEFAMQDSLQVYNKSYATCLKGKGYVVETMTP